MNRNADSNGIPAPPLSPRSAWRWWLLLNQLADELRLSYENDFLEFCIEQCERNTFKQPMTFD